MAQKCVNELFLSRSKILKRLNHRIAKQNTLQNCNKKFCNFQFGLIFQEKLFLMVFNVLTKQRVLILLNILRKKWN